jgi:hypothetical protein
VVHAEPAVLLGSLDAGIDLVRQQAGRLVWPEKIVIFSSCMMSRTIWCRAFRGMLN